MGEDAPDFLKDRVYECDRDEGNVSERWNAALQAYLEWLPLRKGPGSMGVVEDASLTQVIEWGDLASLVVFDTRISYRSKEPTLANRKLLLHHEIMHAAVLLLCTDKYCCYVRLDFLPFGLLAATNDNVTKYSESPLKEQFAAIAESINEEIYNPSYTMIGEYISVLRDVFQESKAAGKTWQIWGGGTSE